jgi:hypothetical protein
MAAFPCSWRTDRFVVGTAAKAGALYFALVFLVGTGFGTGRTLLLEPRLGPVPATLAELPLMLGASWFICRLVVQRLAVPADFAHRVAMGGIAFTLLIAAELVLAVLVSGESATVHFRAYGEAAPLLGLAGQIAFATFPLVLARTDFR